jgi:hypothetical protein
MELAKSKTRMMGVAWASHGDQGSNPGPNQPRKNSTGSPGLNPFVRRSRISNATARATPSKS